MTEIPETSAYFHAQWRRSNPLPYQADHTLPDGVTGQGHFVGAYLAWGVNHTGWWGEAIKFYLDGDDEWPTICGTGTEDYFGGVEFRVPAWPVRASSAGRTGAAAGDQAGRAYRSQQRFWHVSLAHPRPDPFQQDLRHDPGAGLAPLEGSRAICRCRMTSPGPRFWYQTEAHAARVPC